jgi:hypothetical protein
MLLVPLVGVLTGFGFALFGIWDLGRRAVDRLLRLRHLGGADAAVPRSRPSPPPGAEPTRRPWSVQSAEVSECRDPWHPNWTMTPGALRPAGAAHNRSRFRITPPSDAAPGAERPDPRRIRRYPSRRRLRAALPAVAFAALTAATVVIGCRGPIKPPTPPPPPSLAPAATFPTPPTTTPDTRPTAATSPATAATAPSTEPSSQPATVPADTQPTNTQPATTQPATTEPATRPDSQPASLPVTTQPVATQPATTDPRPRSRQRLRASDAARRVAAGGDAAGGDAASHGPGPPPSRRDPTHVHATGSTQP